jgi:putative peptide zinc metalloprotease protein
MNLRLQSYLSLVPINIRKDKKHYIVEDTTSGEFFEMPQICIDAINMINKGKILEDIEMFLKEKYPHEDVDILSFAKELLELHLITEIDGIKVEIKKENVESLNFFSISSSVGKVFFNSVVRPIYLLLFIVNIILFTFHPDLFPHYKDLFIFKFMFLNIPAWMMISFCLVLIHELGHVLAMRAYNLPTRLGVGHRLFLVVFETDMSSVWKLPSKDRNVLYLAGLCFDTTILFLALVGQLAFANGQGIFLGILHVIVFDTFIRMVYQCCVYMKTDLYYLLENVTGCYNLMENAQQFIRKLLPFQRTLISEEVVFAEEKRIVFLYSIFYFVGVGLTLLLFVVYYIPQLIFALKKVLPGFSAGPATIHFWDAALFSVQLLIGVLLLLYSWRKKYLTE